MVENLGDFHQPVFEPIHPVGDLGEVVDPLGLLHGVERAVVGACVERSPELNAFTLDILAEVTPVHSRSPEARRSMR